MVGWCPDPQSNNAQLGPLLTLDDIYERLGHIGKRVTILKLDCEGCEWAALSHAPAANIVRDFVDQLLVEWHFSMALRVTNVDMGLEEMLG